MSMSLSTQDILTLIQGDVCGQLAIGNNNIQIGSNSGVVNIQQQAAPQVTRRPQPVVILPEPFAGACFVARRPTGRTMSPGWGSGGGIVR